MVRDEVSIRPFLVGSLVVHTIGLAAMAYFQGPLRLPPKARVIEVTVLTPKKPPAPKPAAAKAAPAARKPAQPPKAARPRTRPETTPRSVPKEPVTARTSPGATPPSQTPRPQQVGPKPGLRMAEPARRPAGPRSVQVARRDVPDTDFQGLRPRPAAPGSGTPAGPGSNRRDETPGGDPGGGRRFSRARPGISFPGEQLAEEPRLPGGTGSGAREPLPRGVPIGRQDAAVVADPGLVSRQVGGGSPAAGSGSDPDGGPRMARAPETVTFRGGAGGMRLPKAAPRIGGGGGADYVIATGPSTRDADEVRASTRPGVGPGQGGGAGAGIGGGLGHSRGRGIGVDAGEHDLAATQRRPGAGIGAGAGTGVGSSSHGSGREASGELPGTGGRRGFGYGSGSGTGTGSGRGGAKARPGVEGLPFGDVGGAVAGGNPAGGGGKGGGPGGPGTGIQVARRGGGGPGTGAGGSGESGEGNWSGRGRGRGAGGSGVGPGTGTGKGAGPGTHPGSGAGTRGKGNELPGKAGGGGEGGRGLPRYGKAVPGLKEWDEEILGRGFFPDGITGHYYDDPDLAVDHENPDTYLNKPIGAGSTFTRLVAKRKDKRIDFNWNPKGEWGDWAKLLTPLPGVNNVYWSARWVGQVFVPKDDVYTFKFDPLDDGGRLYLRYKAGGPMVKVIDAWRVSATRPETRPYPMKRGPYDIQVEYAQRPEFYAAISLKWKSNSFDWEVIGPYQSGGVRRVRK